MANSHIARHRIIDIYAYTVRASTCVSVYAWMARLPTKIDLKLLSQEAMCKALDIRRPSSFGLCDLSRAPEVIFKVTAPSLSIKETSSRRLS